MIFFIADSIEPWLVYIWKQFVQINVLKSDYEFFTYQTYTRTTNKENCDLLIEYSKKQKYPESLFIPQKQSFQTDDYVWVRKDLPIFSSTLDRKSRDYDIFFNSFVHLSRLEEWNAAVTGKPVRSYSFKHSRKDKRIWKIPIVNLLFNDLEKKINKKCPEIVFGKKERPIIEFSHDVDYLHKTIQLRIKQCFLYFYNFARFFLKHENEKSLSIFKKGIDFAINNSDYWCFDQWIELDNKLGVKSVYYIYAKLPFNKKLSPTKWLLDPSYDIIKNKRLINKCKELISNGNEIGLHGSFFSAIHESFFLEEKYTLEKILNCTVRKSRQHWLNYIEAATPFILDKAGINMDLSLGFNDISGFRSGVASIYNPYDHLNQKPFLFYEMPLVIMDSQIHDYSENTEANPYDWLFKTIDFVKKFAISVNWHQRVISSDYQWAQSYEMLGKRYKSFIVNSKIYQ